MEDSTRAADRQLTHPTLRPDCPHLPANPFTQLHLQLGLLFFFSNIWSIFKPERKGHKRQFMYVSCIYKYLSRTVVEPRTFSFVVKFSHIRLSSSGRQTRSVDKSIFCTYLLPMLIKKRVGTRGTSQGLNLRSPVKGRRLNH